MYQSAAERGERTMREEHAVLVEVANEIALGVWICVSILGVTLGLVTASLAQVWARDVLTPGTVLGAILVIASLCLTLLAAYRYLWRGTVAYRPSALSRALATVSVVVVLLLAWVVLAIIFFTGWEFPVSVLRQPGPEMP